MSVYYNEIDPFAAAWLRELMKANQIPDGEVDERSIELVQPDDLRGFRQCHFFAGIGGWAYALRLAAWPDGRAVWTGSCPCQPWSVAGKSAGTDDSRDLWPAWSRLIAQRHPATVFGEQVASGDGLFWLDRVFVDLEAQAYAVGAADLPAASVTAPHARQRIFFVADAGREGRQQNAERTSRDESAHGRQSHGDHVTASDGEGGDGRLADAAIAGDRGTSAYVAEAAGRARAVGDERWTGLQRDSVGRADEGDGPWLADGDRYHEQWWSGPLQVGWNAIEAEVARGGRRYRAQWRIKPGVSLLAHGIPNRVERLCGFGNAIVPQVAQAFIEAYLDR